MDDSQTAHARQALVDRYLRGEVSSFTHQYKLCAADPHAPVIPVQTAGSKRPFFLLHGSSEGAAYFCYRLARGLGDDQPLYALEPYTHANPDLPSLDIIAAAHVRSLRSVQADGPYLLGGICNGGLIVYEMARQLRTQGQRIALVALMDPWPGGTGSPASHRFARWAIAQFGALRHWDGQRQLAVFLVIYEMARAVGRLPVRVRGWLELLMMRVRIQLLADGRSDERGGAATRGKDSPVSSSACAPHTACGCDLLPQQYSALFRWAALAYDPRRPYDGSVTYFWPSKGVGNRRGWRARARHEDATYTVTGTQDSWRGVDLPALVSQLRRCLEEAQDRIQLASANRERIKTKTDRGSA